MIDILMDSTADASLDNTLTTVVWSGHLQMMPNADLLCESTDYAIVVVPSPGVCREWQTSDNYNVVKEGARLFPPGSTADGYDQIAVYCRDAICSKVRAAQWHIVLVAGEPSQSSSWASVR
jgi:hypothetical protein